MIKIFGKELTQPLAEDIFKPNDYMTVTEPCTIDVDIDIHTLEVKCKDVVINGQLNAQLVLAPFGLKTTHPKNRIESFVGVVNMEL